MPSPTAATSPLQNEDEIVEINSFEFEDTLQKSDQLRMATSSSRCHGYAVILPNGHSPYVSYPFALHDTLSLPWVPQITPDGSLKLVAQKCSGTTTHTDNKCCDSCQNLSFSTALEGILTRIESGVHENSGFAYHSFSGLHDMLKRKNMQVEFYRLRGLNQARKLLGKVAALADSKQLLMAISTGETKRVDRVLSIGIRQKKGI